MRSLLRFRPRRHGRRALCRVGLAFRLTRLHAGFHFFTTLRVLLAPFFEARAHLLAAFLRIGLALLAARFHLCFHLFAALWIRLAARFVPGLHFVTTFLRIRFALLAVSPHLRLHLLALLRIFLAALLHATLHGSAVGGRTFTFIVDRRARQALCRYRGSGAKAPQDCEHRCQ